MLGFINLQGITAFVSQWRCRKQEPAPEVKPTEVHKAWQVSQTMYLTAHRSKERLDYPLMNISTVEVEWVDEADPSITRIPEERIRTFGKMDSLSILGQSYPVLFGLYSPFSSLKHGEQQTDRYARDIICFREKFPCFDSADYLSENRYFYWFFIREGNRLARVFYQDETSTVLVTDDVRHIETSCWKYMQETGFCQPAERQAHHKE